MRAAALALVAVLAAAPSVAAGHDVSFFSPAQLGGEITVHNATWVFVILETGQGHGTVTWPSAAVSNRTQPIAVRIDQSPIVTWTGNPGEPRYDNWTSGPTTSQLGFGARGSAHLLIEADSIEMTASADASLFVPAELSMGRMISHREYTNFVDHQAPTGTIALADASAQDIRIVAHGLRYVQWAGASVNCSNPVSRCPDGGGQREYAASPTGIHSYEMSLEEIQTQGGALTFDIPRANAVVGGASESIAIRGWARLPSATTSGPCNPCSDGTVTLEGNSTLSDLRRVDERHIRGSVSQQDGHAFVDESNVPLFRDGPASTVALATGAAVVGLIGAWKFLAWLLSRPVLESSRRQRIYSFIQENPGANFREIANALSLHQGNLSRHLLILARADLVVQHRSANSVRFFENHGKFDVTWRETALLRDERNRTLLDVVESLGPSTQGDIVRAMAARGFGRSAVQDRLYTLEKAGLVTQERRGRATAYSTPQKLAGKPITVTR
ncbi:MAG: winged helix-turn-helix transcriptional regulator [bacterium]